MLGQGLQPEANHPIADRMSDQELSEFLKGLQASIGRAVDQLPQHQACVERYCEAPLT